MLKYGLVLIFCLMSLYRPASATDKVTFDGVWWQSLTESSKYYVVQGMVATVGTGWANGYGFAAIKLTKKVDPARFSWGADQEPTYTKTFLTYIHEIDDFYTNNPNLLTRVELGALSACLVDKPDRSCDDYAKWMNAHP